MLDDAIKKEALWQQQAVVSARSPFKAVVESNSNAYTDERRSADRERMGVDDVNTE